MSEHLTSNILIYNQSPLLGQLLKQHLPQSYVLECTHQPDILVRMLDQGNYDALLLNLAANETEAITGCISAYTAALPMLALLFPSHVFMFHSLPTISLFTKPLPLQTVVTLIQNLPRLKHKQDIAFSPECIFSPATRNITLGGLSIPLTEKEVALLKYLYEKEGEIASKAELLQQLWKYNEEIDTHTLETHIYRLRQKIGESLNLIITEENGYRLGI